MANTNCSACEEIRQEAPSLIVNGLDDNMCASLGNDTGLVASSGHDDCTDLNNLNDCLVGNEADEVDMYDVCDWKTFMKQFIPNLWTTLKAMICAICGAWSNIHALADKQEEMCKLLDQVASPALKAYGTLPLATTDAARARRCGTLTSKAIKMPDDGTLNPYTKSEQNMGIAYASMVVTGCTSNRNEMLEWIIPNHYLYKLASGSERGDVLWKIKKSEAQSVIGMSDFLWQRFVESAWTWREAALSGRQIAWMKLTVGEHGLASDELGVVFMGCTAPNEAITSDEQISSINNASARLYRHVI